MTAKRAKATGKGASKRGFYVGFPNEVVESKKFKALYEYPHALMLLFQLRAQFSGSNNSSLMMTFKHAKKMGWKSTATLQRAKKMLLTEGFIIEARRGWKNRPSMYAITWMKIDNHPDIDIQPTEKPPKPPGLWCDE